MQDLIARIIENVGIDEALAKPAVGVILNLLKSVLPEDVTSGLLGAIPGAESLLEAGAEAGSGGIGGMLGGAMSSLTGGNTGAITQAMSQLQGLGLDTGQAQGVAQQLLGFAKEHAPSNVSTAIEEQLGSLLG